jgi:hypothetical protein
MHRQSAGWGLHPSSRNGGIMIAAKLVVPDHVQCTQWVESGRTGSVVFRESAS